MLLRKTDSTTTIRLPKFKRMNSLKNFNFNLKNISKVDSFVLFLSFSSPDFFKLSPILVNLVNSFVSKFSSNCSFASASFQEIFFKTSSSAYILCFTDIIPLLLFIDFFLRLKINFFIKGLFDVKKSKFISIFNLAQTFSSKLILPSSPKKFKLQLVESFFNFYYPRLLNLLLLINLIYKK
jgi:hypothetical protein